MSYPNALLHFEFQQAKERLAQLFHAGPGVRDSLSPTLTKGVSVINEQSGGASSVIRFFASPGKNVQLHGRESRCLDSLVMGMTMTPIASIGIKSGRFPKS